MLLLTQHAGHWSISVPLFQRIDAVKVTAGRRISRGTWGLPMGQKVAMLLEGSSATWAPAGKHFSMQGHWSNTTENIIYRSVSKQGLIVGLCIQSANAYTFNRHRVSQLGSISQLEAVWRGGSHLMTDDYPWEGNVPYPPLHAGHISSPAPCGWCRLLVSNGEASVASASCKQMSCMEKHFIVFTTGIYVVGVSLSEPHIYNFVIFTF